MSEMNRNYYEACAEALKLGYSPLPWNVLDLGRKGNSEFAAIHIEANVPIGGGTGMTVAEVFYYKSFQDAKIPRSVVETNAELIVNAVNAYHANQQLITRLTEVLEAVYPSLDCHCYGKHDNDCVKGKVADALAAVAKERAS